MNIDTELEKLRKIRRVDAPPFLYTRIEQSLDSASHSSVSPKLRFAVFSSLLALAIINGFVLSSGSGQETQQSGIRHLASEMNLQSSNDLYE